MKRVLVLGAAGFIGTALCKRLAADGCEVYAVDMGHARDHRPACASFKWKDLRAEMPLDMAYDEIFQLAADVGGVAYLSGGHDADVMASNVAINRNVAQRAPGRCGVLVFTSSACVYPAQLEDFGDMIFASPWSEDQAVGPVNDYGLEKLFSERLYQAHARDHGLNVRIARLGNVYGPGEPIEGPRAHLVGDLCRKAMTPGAIEVWGDGTQVRSMVYIDDVVDALVMLARAPQNPGPVNIAGPPATVKDIAGKIADISVDGKLGRAITWVPGRPTGAHSSALDVSKARTELGWEAKTPLFDGLRATYEWAAQRIAKRAA